MDLGTQLLSPPQSLVPFVKLLKGAFCGYGNTGLKTINIQATRSQRSAQTDRQAIRNPDALRVYSATADQSSALQLYGAQHPTAGYSS